MMRTITRAIVVICLFVGFTAEAQPKRDLTELDLQSLTARVVPLTSCYAGSMSCNSTVSGRVSLDSCESDGMYAVGYSFNGTQGTRVTIRGRSAEFAATIIIGDGRQGQTAIYARHDVYGYGETAEIRDFVLPYTGPYLIMITPLVSYRFGDYTLSITCATGNSSCTPNDTTVCLLGGRFRASISYRNQFSNPPGQAGSFSAARLNQSAVNPDTAIFGFGNAQNVEVTLRVVDARPFAPRFDIYYGGMTDVEYWVNVQDTQTGRSVQYYNAPGVVGGGVDRSTFPAN